ncbi:hypothetical protein SUGI_1328570 [Cryptomeria japonica]|uniref:Uncharacterized protein n=1 Tax=Cryptomeria japonica TaxID=3369 RepID=A0AAD3RPN4_CRYJA|nr:hypothetical protein SUGI_1328490 [Cryptomeria japonica]GLJ57431.1 hypothetical protein SUGI_1328530 [Cryptomeria japonica]GLJ57435.1 hypothetical protein SUGI_1328570 [Cryptomeria japonica]
MSGHLNELSQAGNSPTVNNISVPGEQYCNEMLPNKDILSSEQTMNCEGPGRVSLCAKDSSDREALHREEETGLEEEKGMELIQLLLESAQTISEAKYDHAAGLVSKCEDLSCQMGNPTQRLGYYISDALKDRIEHEG